MREQARSLVAVAVIGATVPFIVRRLSDLIGGKYMQPIYLDPWMFIALCLAAAVGIVGTVLYFSHWAIHRSRPKDKAELLVQLVDRNGNALPNGKKL